MPKTEAQLNEDATEKSDLIWLMSDPRGRRLMAGLLGRGHIDTTTFTGNSETYAQEGARRLALVYFRGVERFCPDKYLTMKQEQNAELNKKKIREEHKKQTQSKGSNHG